MIDDAKLLETVVKEFEALTRIPRPSGHEKAVSDYLKKRFEEIGCTVTQDEALNIIAEMTATKGGEAAPRTILQGHMDMVCVAKPGVTYDPLSDPIKMVRTKESLTHEPRRRRRHRRRGDLDRYAVHGGTRTAARHRYGR